MKEHEWASREYVREKNARMARSATSAVQDTMQVCLSGHKITGWYNKSPSLRRDHCERCGNQTTTKCPNCQAIIKGDLHYPSAISSDDSEVQDFCDSCGKPYPWNREEAEFLAADSGNADASNLLMDKEVKAIIQSRLDDAGKCLQAGVAMPVIFACGSAVEGMLFAYATSNPRLYNQATAAPKKDGTTRPIPEWTLDQLINVAKEVGHINEVAKKHAHSLKDFRNYIHPREQLEADFNPTIDDGKVCYEVTKLIISNLEKV